MKTCNTCRTAKSAEHFYKDRAKSDGLTTQCRDCKRSAVLKYKAANREVLSEKSRAYRDANIEKCREREREYQLANRDARNARVSRFYQNNPEKIAEYREKYLSKDSVRESIRIWSRERARKRRATDIDYVLRQNLRSRMHYALRAKNLKKSSKTFEAVGCSPIELREYLEGKFLIGMTWDNYGEWHIDHVIPLSSAKDYEEIIRLSHYTNLQPLWAMDNLKKGAKFDYCAD